jgi:hypothetical protein
LGPTGFRLTHCRAGCQPGRHLLARSRFQRQEFEGLVNRRTIGRISYPPFPVEVRALGSERPRRNARNFVRVLVEKRAAPPANMPC